MMAGALCVALLTGIAAVAQVPPPDPANPNETIADASNAPPYGEPINTETAKKAAAAPSPKPRSATGVLMRRRRWSVGDLVYFEKQDNCQYVSVLISPHKARASARYRRGTLVFERLWAGGPFSPIFDARRRDCVARRQSDYRRRQGDWRHRCQRRLRCTGRRRFARWRRGRQVTMLRFECKFRRDQIPADFSPSAAEITERFRNPVAEREQHRRPDEGR